MKLRRPSLTTFMVALTAVIIGIYCWPRSTQLSTASLPKQRAPANEAHHKVAANSAGADHSERDKYTDCYDSFYRQLRLEACDSQCFADFVRPKDSELADFIEEGWDAEGPMPETPRSRTGRFYRGAILAGILVSDHKDGPVNLRESLEIFQGLVNDDPDNGAPRIFLALLQKWNGRNDEALESLRMAASLEYKSYLADINLRLGLAVGEDLRMWLRKTIFWAQLPFTNLSALQELRHLDETAYYAFATGMTREGLKRKSKGFELTWTAIEHQVGIQMMHEVDQTAREKVLSFNKLVTLPEPTLFYEENVGCSLASTQDFVKRRYREMLELTEKAEQK